MKTKKEKNNNEIIIELITFARCSQESLENIKQECKKQTYLTLTPEILEQLTDIKTKVFERDKYGYFTDVKEQQNN